MLNVAASSLLSATGRISVTGRNRCGASGLSESRSLGAAITVPEADRPFVKAEG